MIIIIIEIIIFENNNKVILHGKFATCLRNCWNWPPFYTCSKMPYSENCFQNCINPGTTCQLSISTGTPERNGVTKEEKEWWN